MQVNPPPKNHPVQPESTTCEDENRNTAHFCPLASRSPPLVYPERDCRGLEAAALELLQLAGWAPAGRTLRRTEEVHPQKVMCFTEKD